MLSLNKLNNSSNSSVSPKDKKVANQPLKPKPVFLFIYNNIAVYIKKNKRITKFKIRRGQHLFTFKTEKPEMAKRLTDSLDTNQIEKVEIKKRIVAKKANK
jgi:hypothetical protein